MVSIAYNKLQPYHIVGESALIKFLLKEVERIAKTNYSVLLTGETGVGKELFARCIHAKSNRANMPFIPVNCGGITNSLLESEFFGYTSGAFTGANINGRQGAIQASDKGTLFLDEIGELNETGQKALLRVLNDKVFYPVGSTKQSSSDFRLICATNANLDELLNAGKLRADFYYRIKKAEYFIPPLRERSEDIALLTEYFLDKYFQELGAQDSTIKKKTIKDSAIFVLQKYSWPGNVRELETVIQRCTMFETEYIEDGDIVVALGNKNSRKEIQGVLNDKLSNDSQIIILSKALAELGVSPDKYTHLALEWFHQKKVSKQFIAEMWGYSKSAFYRLLARHQIGEYTDAKTSKNAIAAIKKIETAMAEKNQETGVEGNGDGG